MMGPLEEHGEDEGQYPYQEHRRTERPSHWATVRFFSDCSAASQATFTRAALSGRSVPKARW